MNNPSDRVINYVLDKAEAEPIAVRIELYRDLSTLIANETSAARLVKIADELASTLSTYRQLRFDLGDDSENGGGAS